MTVTKSQCFVCSNPQATTEPVDGQIGRSCPRCGNYILLGTITDVLLKWFARREISRSLFSHYLRKRQRMDGQAITVVESDISLLITDGTFPNPQEQFDNLIRWVGDAQPNPSAFAKAPIWLVCAVIGTPVELNRGDEPGFAWLYREISGMQMIEQQNEGSHLILRLTLKGWARYEELKHRTKESFTAFMAMKFNEANVNRALTDCFKPAAHEAGFELRPLNEAQPAGLVDNQIRAAIRNAAFVLADLTHDNNGAYFEAGFAEGLGIPVIYTCEAEKFRKEKTHFDTNHMVTIIWSESTLDDARAKLVATIRNSLPLKAKW